MRRCAALLMTLPLLSLSLLPMPLETVAASEETTGYRRPPAQILDVLNAPTAPTVSLNPPRTLMLLVRTQRYPSIAEVSAPMLRLAGLRLNPKTHGPHRSPQVEELVLVDVATGRRRQVPLPESSRAGLPVWSPDGGKFAFAAGGGGGSPSLYVVDATAAEPKPRLAFINLNASLGQAFTWMPDSKGLICRIFDVSQPRPPAPPEVPSGPIVQESFGKQAPVRTLQDLLQNPHDEALLEYHARCVLVWVDAEKEASLALDLPPGLYDTVEPAPNGSLILLSRIMRPYSYQLAIGSFPRSIFVVDPRGKLVHPVADTPLRDQVPIEGVPTGPRSIQWRANAPATLVWVEAQDGGDPKKKVPHRDYVFQLDLADSGKPPAKEMFRTEHRFAGITWGEQPDCLLFRDFDRDTRKSRQFLLRLNTASRPEPKLIFERSIQDRYGDPGTPLMKRLGNGEQVMIQLGDQILLSGPGSSPQGDRPFLDRFNLANGDKQRLWQAGADSYESVVALLDESGGRFITRHESPSSPPNYFEVSLKEGQATRRALTDFKDPTPQLRGITKKLVRYKRPDGVNLSFTLYLPPGYQEGTRLPAVVWAYPREFNDPSVAGQVVGSPQRFTTLGGTSHLFFLLAGYAVLDDATMPVVGDPETANDTFIEQIVASAKAAIDKADELGVIDPKRVGVGGHSYGAFMTANLLAHCDLFRAGIARSGAYNRTLTPFGFQSERRTLWEAPDIYTKLSPFMYAHKIKEPLLIIHGAADNNPGTFPMQSERLFHAVRGNGGNVRYVSLPNESHGYAARESIEHCLFEMISWFDQHVKEAK